MAGRLKLRFKDQRSAAFSDDVTSHTPTLRKLQVTGIYANRVASAKLD